MRRVKGLLETECGLASRLLLLAIVLTIYLYASRPRSASSQRSIVPDSAHSLISVMQFYPVFIFFIPIIRGVRSHEQSRKDGSWSAIGTLPLRQ